MDLKNLGELIKEEREKKAISLEKISEETKIPVKFLKYIEEGEIDKLPSKTHTRAILTKYLNYFNLKIPFEEIFQNEEKEKNTNGENLKRKIDKKVYLSFVLFLIFLTIFFIANKILQNLSK